MVTSKIKQIIAKTISGGLHQFLRHFYNNKDILDCLTISECRERWWADLWYQDALAPVPTNHYICSTNLFCCSCCFIHSLQQQDCIIFWLYSLLFSSPTLPSDTSSWQEQIMPGNNLSLSVQQTFFPTHNFLKIVLYYWTTPGLREFDTLSL